MQYYKKRDPIEISQSPAALSTALCLSWPENRENKYEVRARVKLPGEEVEMRGGRKAVLRGLRVRI